ncbi:MAG: cell division protein FtsZ [Candidatus Nealsonbacteria bacterium]
MKKKSKSKTKKPALTVSTEEVKKTKIRVIGIGGGGGAIISEIASKMPKASFVIANTDLQALKNRNKKASIFNFGQTLTHGLGTGMNVEIGREAALLEKDKIKKLMEGYDLCILVSCLGGGTGSGAAPVFAKIAKSLGSLTYGIFTLPLKFEGERKMDIAKESLRQVKNHLNAITVIPNEKVFQVIDKNTPLKQAFSVINKDLAESLGGLIETIYEPGMINIDFADLRTVLEGTGRIAYLNTVEVQRKEGSLKELIVKILNSPLYPYGIKGAKGVLFNISGEKTLSLNEVSQISKTISDLTNPEAKIIFGISQKSSSADMIKTTILATGCSFKIASPLVMQPKKKIRKKPSIFVKKKKNKKREIETPQHPEKPETPVTPEKKEKLKKKRRKIKKIKVEKPIELKEETTTSPLKIDAERKNGLQLKREAEDIEKEMQEKESFWETPAFLRKNNQEK